MQMVMGGETEFNGLVFGDKHPGTLNFLQNQLSSGFSQTLTDVGKQMFSNLGSLFERFNGTQALNLVKAARRKVTNLFEQDVIKPLWDILDIQQATLTMQRWIMACPDIRKLYHQQRCDGFSDSYVDVNPGVIGDKHYDYRRVMDGYAQTDEDGTLQITYYYDEDHAEDTQLSLADKNDIVSTWDAIRRYLSDTDYDPTSKYGESL